jgi:hypothetical protein
MSIWGCVLKIVHPIHVTSAGDLTKEAASAENTADLLVGFRRLPALFEDRLLVEYDYVRPALSPAAIVLHIRFHDRPGPRTAYLRNCFMETDCGQKNIAHVYSAGDLKLELSFSQSSRLPRSSKGVTNTCLSRNAFVERPPAYVQLRSQSYGSGGTLGPRSSFSRAGERHDPNTLWSGMDSLFSSCRALPLQAATSHSLRVNLSTAHVFQPGSSEKERPERSYPRLWSFKRHSLFHGRLLPAQPKDCLHVE